jgi:hypothetical protein
VCRVTGSVLRGGGGREMVCSCVHALVSHHALGRLLSSIGVEYTSTSYAHGHGAWAWIIRYLNDVEVRTITAHIYVYIKCTRTYHSD